MDFFSRATRTWFEDTFERPTPVQDRGWERIATGDHALLLAPTGSGKTLAAFLWAIDRVAQPAAESDAPAAGVRVLYVSPLKALVYDIERNLRAPLAGIQRTAERLGDDVRGIRVDVRTGDTPQRDRNRQRRDPADVLVTTPESLFLLLGSRARETLATVETVIVDEVHAVAPTKRGAHLALSLERLAALASRDPQRIGLSATVRPADEVARFLGGDRPVEIVDAARPPALSIEIAVPVPDMENPGRRDGERPERGGSLLGELYAGNHVEPSERRHGLWPSMYPELLERLRAHRSTIVFVNNRGLCERLANKLNELAGETLVLAHHGSVSHEKRQEIEEGLKAGRVRGLVATSSLELGVDMGAVDQVILVESPGSVARGLQRVGRAGHGVGETSRGVIFPKFRGDLLECTVVAERMQQGALEKLRIPTNALDVLAQQVVAIVADRPCTTADLESLVRRAHPYRRLTRAALSAVLDMLTGRYPSDDFADLRPRLGWDRTRDLLSARRGAAMISRMNAGTIPDRGLYGVHLGAGGPRVGELDEEMVFESRVGEVVVLGATSWRIVEITRDRVLVEPAPGEPGKLPFWRGDGLGRPAELGRAVGAFVREIGALPREQAVERLGSAHPLDANAARNLADYIADQKEHNGVLPTDQSITIERFRDELGDWRVCILSPHGAPVHAPWALALQSALSAQRGFEVVAMYGDDGIVLTFADGDDLPDVDALLPDPDSVEELITDQLTGSALFGASFRENAARALLLPRRNPRARSPLWAQRLKAKNLLAAVLRYSDFPIVIETYRHCLVDVFDLPGLVSLLRAIRSREIRVDSVETHSASPFARSLVFAYVASYMYEYDQPLAERRAQALTLDRGLLRDLLGQAELRDLLDVEVIDRVESILQHLSEDRRARDADELHDVLRKLGALDVPSLVDRAMSDGGEVRAWLDELAAQRRAASIRLGRTEHWIAAQDAALYRDALGAQPPAGLPGEFLRPRPDPLTVLVRRYARVHGPFVTRSVAEHLRLREAQVKPVLEQLESRGELVRGEFRPGGTETEWCDRNVLRRIKRETLAMLRGQVAPVDATALARFLPAWHGIGEARSPGMAGASAALLERALGQLEGCAIAWSSWTRELLPARVPGFTAEDLDMLCASGQVVWIGRGALGPSDGRIAIHRREHAAHLLETPEPIPEPSPLHRAILDHLEQRGASFTVGLQRAARAAAPDVTSSEFETALWDLVWAGIVTNDTFGPLRALGRRRSERRRGAAANVAGGRWSLVAELLDPDVTPTERAHARAAMLLERYGVASREVARAEDLPGGFGAVYGVLAEMEEAGRIRRGYFVEGLTGAQFAMAGAVDRLRDARENDASPQPVVLALAADDPALAWGAVLPWPATGAGDDGRPRRVPGAAVILVDGAPVLWVSANRRSLLTFPEYADESRLSAALAELRDLPGRRALILEKIDGQPARTSAQRSVLEAKGFVEDYRGLVLGVGARPG